MKIISTAKDAKGRKGNGVGRDGRPVAQLAKANRRIFSEYQRVLVSFANLRVLCGEAVDWQSE
jgi:hypothetical protein